MQKINIDVAFWEIWRDLKQASFSASPMMTLPRFHAREVESANMILKMKVEDENLESVARTKEILSCHLSVECLRLSPELPFPTCMSDGVFWFCYY